MEKILLALDAHQVNTSTIDFACYIAKLSQSRLTGVFLEGIAAAGYQYMRGSGDASYDDNAAQSSPDIVRMNIDRFRESCTCRETASLIHRDRGIPLSEMAEESRFSDLVIVDPTTSFNTSDRTIPSRFIKNVLMDSECPVLIAPYSFEGLDQVIFAYNGSSSSVFAIKQFTYLFPGLSDKKVIVLNVQESDTQAIEHQFKMKEWLRAHYGNLEFIVLKGDPSDELFGYLIEKKNAIVVMGAYGRSILSGFFNPSHARLIVKTINLPVFIAHQ